MSARNALEHAGFATNGRVLIIDNGRSTESIVDADDAVVRSPKSAVEALVLDTIGLCGKLFQKGLISTLR